MRVRSGVTLVELMITVTLVGLLVYIAGSELRSSIHDKTKEAAQDVVDVFRRGSYVASRQNVAVVVDVQYSDGDDRGSVTAWQTTSSTCPGTVPTTATGTIVGEVDFGTSADELGAGMAEADHTVDAGYCILPNGRIIDNDAGTPLLPDGLGPEDMAGDGFIWVQWDPVRRADDDSLIVPWVQVEIPFNGLVRIPHVQ